MTDPFAVAAHTIEDWGGGPEPQKGDYVWVRGIYVGDSEVKPDADCVVDVFSSNTQYDVTVRKDMVVLYGPEWWPPCPGDIVVMPNGVPWYFTRSEENGLIWARTFVDLAGSGAVNLSGESSEVETWRGGRLVARDGKPVDY